MKSHPLQILSRPAIVIVEDDKAVRNALRFRMELEEWQVFTYASAEAVLALDFFHTQGRVVLDQILPGLSGLDLLFRLRDRGVKLPAIIITTNPSTALRADAAEGGVAIVEKPLLNDTLIEAVRGAISPYVKR